MTTRLIANKYREGKAKRTLKRELKVLEIVKGEANVAVEFARSWIACDDFVSVSTSEKVAPTGNSEAKQFRCSKAPAFGALLGYPEPRLFE